MIIMDECHHSAATAIRPRLAPFLPRQCCRSYPSAAHEASCHGRRHVCVHKPPCPRDDSPARDCARVLDAHPEQGWSRLCNNVIAFDDHGDILPSGAAIAPHPAAARRDGVST